MELKQYAGIRDYDEVEQDGGYTTITATVPSGIFADLLFAIRADGYRLVAVTQEGDSRLGPRDLVATFVEESDYEAFREAQVRDDGYPDTSDYANGPDANVWDVRGAFPEEVET